MGSLRFEGILFSIYPHDHLPRHVHGYYGRTAVVIELLPGGAQVADRHDAIQPSAAKRSDVARILRLAEEHHRELNRLWESIHGTGRS